jgi:hypothetical protein
MAVGARRGPVARRAGERRKAMPGHEITRFTSATRLDKNSKARTEGHLRADGQIAALTDLMIGSALRRRTDHWGARS